MDLRSQDNFRNDRQSNNGDKKAKCLEVEAKTASSVRLLVLGLSYAPQLPKEVPVVIEKMTGRTPAA